MMELSLELRQLVEAAKDTSRPTATDSTRVFEAIKARLGLAVGFASSAAAVVAAPEAGMRLLTTKSVVSAVLALAGLALLYSAMRGAAFDLDEPPKSGPTNDARDADPPRQSLLGETLELPLASPPLPAAEGGGAKTTTLSLPRPRALAPDPLSEEVAILSHAEQELHRGRVASALRLLNEHERKYKDGVLAEERIAARIQALCALGRVGEADAQEKKLPPLSMHSDSVRHGCAKARLTPAVR